MKKKKQKLSNTIRTTKYMLSFVLKREGGKAYIVIYYFLNILNALCANIIILFPGLIINELTNDGRIYNLVVYVAVLVLLPTILALVNSLMNVQKEKASQKLGTSIAEYLYQHIACMDYETLENPEIQVLEERAINTLNSCMGVVNRLSVFFAAIVSVLTLFTIISTLNPAIIVLIVIVIYINSLMTKRTNGKAFEINKELSKYDRIQSVFPFMLTNLTNAKEVRLFNLKDYFIDLSRKSKINSHKLELQMCKNSNRLQLFRTITTMIQKAILYLYFIYCVLVKMLSVGTMTIYLTASERFSSALNDAVSAYLSLSQNSMDISEMIDFFNIPLKQYQTGDKEPKFNSDSTIEFKHVWFKYPGSQRYALQDMNLTIHGSERLCIVGENGSGKSTFIKLLTRLYFPEKGEILLNGVNINEYDYLKYQRLFAPVFQDYITYSLPLKSNIMLADIENLDRLEDVCKKTGIIELVNKLPKGFETQVHKYIDEEGFDPSGGEGQRMAIARALYHDGSVFLLDEPTAALDPNAEYEIYTQFHNMIAGKCAVLITHRLSAVQLADKVAVFDDGHVAEYGTHTELYAKGGIYTEMFDKQAQFYRNNPTGDDASE